MPQHELEVIKLSIPFSLKSPLADHRHRLVRVIKNLIVRMKEVSRAASKNADKEVLYLKSVSRESELEGNEIVCYAKVCDKSVADICDWLSSLLLESLYPGSPFEREVLALDLIHAVFDSLEIANAPLRKKLDWCLNDARMYVEEDPQYRDYTWILKPSVTNKGINISIHNSWTR